MHGHCNTPMARHFINPVRYCVASGCGIFRVVNAVNARICPLRLALTLLTVDEIQTDSFLSITPAEVKPGFMNADVVKFN